jgi:hypothetical protein
VQPGLLKIGKPADIRVDCRLRLKPDGYRAKLVDVGALGGDAADGSQNG